jgi:hypothetical protein
MGRRFISKTKPNFQYKKSGYSSLIDVGLEPTGWRNAAERLTTSSPHRKL